MRPDVFLLQCLLYLIMDGAYLPLTLTTADNKVTGEAANLTHIKQCDIGGLLFAGSGNCFSRYVNCIQ
jgi:hypothetical protein